MTNQPKAERLLTKTDAAERVGVHVITIERHLSAGRLTRFTSPGQRGVRIDVDELDALYSWHPEPAAANN